MFILPVLLLSPRGRNNNPHSLLSLSSFSNFPFSYFFFFKFNMFGVYSLIWRNYEVLFPEGKRENEQVIKVSALFI